MTTLFPVSSTPAISQTAPIAIAPKPSSDEPQRPEHAERPEEQRGQDDEPDREQDAPVAHRRDEHRERLRLARARRPGVAAAQAAMPSEAIATAPNVQPVPATEAIAAEHGAEERARDGGGERLADQRAAPRRAASAATSQASAPVHENALASPWQEAREVELPRLARRSRRAPSSPRRSSCRRARSA